MRDLKGRKPWWESSKWRLSWCMNSPGNSCCLLLDLTRLLADRRGLISPAVPGQCTIQGPTKALIYFLCQASEAALSCCSSLSSPVRQNRCPFWPPLQFWLPVALNRPVCPCLPWTQCWAQRRRCLAYFWGRNSEVYMSRARLHTLLSSLSVNTYEHLLPPPTHPHWWV